MTTFGETGEGEIIRRLGELLPRDAKGDPFIGDDTAVVPGMEPGYDGLLTTDPLVEGIHFLADTEPARVGHKAVGRVLSDIAAMGGEPRWILVNVIAPADTPVAWIEEAYSGLLQLALRHDAKVVGGDVAEGPVRELHVFGVGRVAEGRAVRRSGARAGDHLFVTGSLGGSLKGKHLDFEPRVAEGSWLAAFGIQAMIDLSDGLATDLRHLAEASGVGVRVHGSNLPLSEACASPGAAWCDGEDYELLFSLSPEKSDRLRADWCDQFETPCSRIGRCTDQSGCYELEGPDGDIQALDASGFEHFKGASSS